MSKLDAELKLAVVVNNHGDSYVFRRTDGSLRYMPKDIYPDKGEPDDKYKDKYCIVNNWFKEGFYGDSLIRRDNWRYTIGLKLRDIVLISDTDIDTPKVTVAIPLEAFDFVEGDWHNTDYRIIGDFKRYGWNLTLDFNRSRHSFITRDVNNYVCYISNWFEGVRNIFYATLDKEIEREVVYWHFHKKDLNATLRELQGFMSDIDEYVDNINIAELLDGYGVKDVSHEISRPGHDDYYFVSIEPTYIQDEYFDKILKPHHGQRVYSESGYTGRLGADYDNKEYPNVVSGDIRYMLDRYKKIDHKKYLFIRKLDEFFRNYNRMVKTECYVNNRNIVNGINMYWIEGDYDKISIVKGFNKLISDFGECMSKYKERYD